MTSNALISLLDAIPLWVMLIPLLISSIILLAVFIERMVFFRGMGANYPDLIFRTREHRDDRSRLSSILGDNNDPVTDLIRRVVLEMNGEAGEQIIRREAEKSVRRIEKYAGIVSTIATIAPMLGLLGTVTGMMKSFSGLSTSGPAAHDILARGITEALVTTALGLIIAIPALMFYNYLVSRIEFAIRDVEYVVRELEEMYERGGGSPRK